MTLSCAPTRTSSIPSSARATLCWPADEGVPFFDDIYRVQLDRLVHRAFIVHGTVRKRDGLPSVQDLFRLAVHVRPEVTLDDLSHDHTRMVMARL